MDPIKNNGKAKSRLDRFDVPLPDPAMPQLTDEALAQMNHRQWLVQFSQTLEITPKEQHMPMTPFRAGCITRLRMAAQYIDLLSRQIKDLKNQNDQNEGEGR